MSELRSVLLSGVVLCAAACGSSLGGQGWDSEIRVGAERVSGEIGRDEGGTHDFFETENMTEGDWVHVDYFAERGDLDSWEYAGDWESGETGWQLDCVDGTQVESETTGWGPDSPGGDADLVEVPASACEEGKECDDGNPCTFLDTCTGGECIGEPYECDDYRPCTLDECDGLGNCRYTLMVGYCLINGVCASAGSEKPSNQCLFCSPAVNPYAWTEKPFSPCDDEDACTTGDKCLNGVCVGEILVCDDGNECTFDLCDPEVGCFHSPANVECDDGDPCTAMDFCESGECKGGPTPPCDDGNPCTHDSCLPGKGCFHESLDGLACDDMDVCTIGDSCFDSTCVPGATLVTCDDWNDCTDDVCDPLKGCIFPLNGNPCCINDINVCDDSDPCTIDTCNVETGACIYLPNEGSCTDKDACTVNDTCIGGVCIGQPADCDDGNECTLDFCDKKVGCIHENLNTECNDGNVCTLNDWCVDGKCTGTKLNCNDYNLCTADACDPEIGCVHEFTDAACNDNDLCTFGDHCVQGKCVGEPKNCDDSNPCTDDLCIPSSGCQNLFNSAPCDDGNECTQGDFCSGGVCVPGKVVCATCDYSFSDAVNRVTKMQIAGDKKPGNALDLDGNGTLDNSLAGISSIANDPLQKALDKGDINLLMEHHGIKTNGGIYTLAVFLGTLAPGFEQCAFTTNYCGYTVKKDMLDQETCQAVVLFDNASIFQGKLVAGGKKYKFPWQVPIAEGTTLDIVLYNATINADVALQQGVVTSINGIIGGAVPKQSFIDAVNAVPDDQLPMSKDMILQLLQVLVNNDIDTDGNGSKDAASIAIKFSGIAAGISGTD